MVTRILSKLSEGASVHRVVEGFVVLFLLIVVLVMTMILNDPWLLIVFGITSIYGSYHLRGCRNLYQDYLWGVEGAGHRLENRYVYLGIIRSIVCVEILMIVGGLVVTITPMLSIGVGVARIIALAITASFAVIAVVGHFTRVRLYRIFMSRVRGGG